MTVTLVLHRSQCAFDITGEVPATVNSDGSTSVLLSPPAQSMRCRNCDESATTAIRSGLEWHPHCGECASWWAPHRQGPLAAVEPDYEYEHG